MHTRWMVLAAVAAFAGSSPLWAQRTSDQARLSLGISAGATAGTHLWTINGQPLFDGPAQVDTMTISRRTRGSLAVVFHGTYFPGEHMGFTGEAMLLGLGHEDDCQLTFPTGSTRNAEVCNTIRSGESPSTAVALSLGTMYRIWSRKVISPYLRANAGLVITQHSPVETAGISGLGTDTETDVIIYSDPSRGRANPVLGLGVGFTAALGHGYQLRWELRDNIVGIERVDGPTFGTPNLEPPHSRTFKHVISMTFGFDVILERRRGRRY